MILLSLLILAEIVFVLFVDTSAFFAILGIALFGAANYFGVFSVSWPIVLASLAWSIPAYLATGFFWSLFRWFNVLLKIKHIVNKYNLYRYVKPSFTNTAASQPIRWPYRDEMEKFHFQELFSDVFDDNGSYKKPNALEYKLKIFNWFIFWPFSVLNFALIDLWEMFYRTCGKALANTFNKITDSVLGE